MRPTRQQRLMHHARVEAEQSSCSRGGVGCVFAKDGRILVTGYNGAPAGMPHCNHECNCGHGSSTEFSGPHQEYCTVFKPCTISVHAEANAIAFAAKHGVCLEGSELYSTYSPCIACAQLLINVGIIAICPEKLYRVPEGLDLLVQAGIQVIDWSDSV